MRRGSAISVGFPVLTRKTSISFRSLHRQALVADLHCDSILDHITGRRDITRRTRGHVDLPKLVAGGVKAQVFAIFPDPKKIQAGEYEGFVLKAAAAIRRLCQLHPARLGLALSPRDLARITTRGRIAVVIGVEGGHALEGDLDRIYRFFRAGVRILTLTWCNSNELAAASWDRSPPHQGLSPLGREAVRIMNRLGMIIDLSHAAESSFYQVLELSLVPVIASHSGVYALRRHNRNLKNDQLNALLQQGGMMGQVFLPAFLSPEPEQASIDDVIRAIDYVVQRFGPRAVGLGSDFDGFSGRLRGLEHAGKLPEVTRRLLQLGYNERDVRLILGQNFLRVWQEVWQAKKETGT